jgi:hypothetical protein
LTLAYLNKHTLTAFDPETFFPPNIYFAIPDTPLPHFEKKAARRRLLIQ